MSSSQNKSLLKALRRGARITPLQALKQFGIFRLAARIAELRKSHNIHTDMVRRGGKVVAQYRMGK